MDIDIDQSVLKRMVERLVAGVNPDRVVLFGSRARGDHRLDSDVDLLIIKHSDEPRHQRVRKAYQALRGIGVAKDVLWYTPSEIEEWSAVRNHITTRALREGKILYEK